VTLLPVTIDGSEIPPDAPRSQGMDDETAALVADAAESYRSVALHLHADVAGRDVTLTAANCAPGDIVFAFGDGASEISERVAQGDTPTATHTYLADGVFTTTLRHSNGERVDLDVAVNWPPPPPDWMGATP
jgi:hypothetical protein